MHAKVLSATTIGVGAHIVEVEVDLSFGLMNFCIVGLPDKAIKESKDRIRAALKNTGLRLPERLITVNLAPAHLKKEDVLFDVPIAVAILQASRLIDSEAAFYSETLFLGELSLDGTIRGVCGVLSIAHAARAAGKKRLIVPQCNTEEASLMDGLEVLGVSHLHDLVAYLRRERTMTPVPSSFQVCRAQEQALQGLDFAQVRGQWHAKRALEIAAAGEHNLLFVGPPGSGKTMLAKRLPTILPEMGFDEVIEATKIYSVAALLDGRSLIVQRPFRSPHHTISQAGLVGGGSNPRPGEVSLAHHGVLFLDELTEFKRMTLEVLRQPLEGQKVLISRANFAVEYPAQFMLVAALNPCPCGFYGDVKGRCGCSPKQIAAYFGKLSGPLLDRIDVHVHVSALSYDELAVDAQPAETSEQIRARVEQARQRQYARQGNVCNAHMSTDQIDTHCQLTADAEAVLKKAFERLGLSMRGYHKILKLARTIADLDQKENIERKHIQQAITYRSLDRLQEVP